MARQQYSVSLTPEEKAFVLQLGGGSISKGLRRAVEIAMRDEPDIKEIKAEVKKLYSVQCKIFAHVIKARLEAAAADGASEPARRWGKANARRIEQMEEDILAGNLF
ncbi:hypothetical protein D6779_04580 [Candidatus Parcubacteria bacterium]|nr:MAG: hypothetical protein D6779_04580 [Candidatus Parcubacteria bacterium]